MLNAKLYKKISGRNHRLQTAQKVELCFASASLIGAIPLLAVYGFI
jgi:hypothetical protein